MKIGVFVTNIIYPPNSPDQWITGRCEGRSAINCAFGYALLGHEVDIIGLPTKKNVFPGVSFLSRDDFDPTIYYDIVHSWMGGIPYGSHNYGRLLRFVEPSNPIDTIKKIISDWPRTEIYTVSRKAVKLFEREGMDLGYLPALYPIPCLPGIEKQDFLPFNVDLKKKTLNVFVFVSSWQNYYICCDSGIARILRRLRDHHKMDLNLTIMILEKNRGNNHLITPEMGSIMKEFKYNVVKSENMCYSDVLNILMKSDICITKGGWCYAGNCAFDIISLGKLLFYVTEGMVPGAINVNINDLYPLDRYVIRVEDSAEIINHKVDNIIHNPLECYAAMKNELITYSFPEWSKIVTKILDRSCK